MLEVDVARAILLRWGRHPRLRLWRANVGVGWFANGQPARKTDPGAYPVHFGVKGQADYTGALIHSFDPLIGRRFELETKSPTGKQKKEQLQYQAMCESIGVLYVLAPSLELFDQAMAREEIFLR